MNKMDSIKFHASNVKNNSNNAFNGAVFESFKQNQINSKTSVTQQKDVFVPNNPPKKEAGLKHLFNALPDSYIDEIIVGGLAIAATSYFIFSGRARNRVLNGLKNGVDDLSRKFDDADSAVKQVETSISTIANDMSAHKNTVETAQKLATDAQQIASVARTHVLAPTFPTEVVDVNMGKAFLNLATNVNGYGVKETELAATLQKESTKRIFGAVEKVISNGQDVTIRVPSSEFAGVAKTGGLAVVPPELMANLGALVHGKQNVRFVLDMPLYHGKIDGKNLNVLRKREDGLFDLVNVIAKDKNGNIAEKVALGKLEKIAEINVPIKTDLQETQELVQVFLQKDRKTKIDYELAKRFIPQEQQEAINKMIEAKQPAQLRFGNLSAQINDKGVFEASIHHDAVFYYNRKFDMSGPAPIDRAKDIYSNTFATDETERFIYFDKFFYEFLRKEDEHLAKPIGVDAVLANDWQTGGIPALMKMYTKVLEATGMEPKKAEKLYNVPIFTLMHNAGLDGHVWAKSNELGNSPAKLLNILFGEHSAFITKNAFVPQNMSKENFNALFTGVDFNPQTMAAIYSDTIIPVSKGYGNEIANLTEFGGNNMKIFKLRQEAHDATSDWKKAKLGIPADAKVDYRNLSYEPIVNGLDRNSQLLTNGIIERELVKGLNIPAGAIKPFKESGMSVVDWHLNNKRILLKQWADDLNELHAGTASATKKHALSQIRNVEKVNLTGVDENTMVISTLGRAEDQKGFDIFAGAIEKFYEKNKNLSNPPVFLAQSNNGTFSNLDPILAVKERIRKNYGDKAADRIIVATFTDAPGRFDSLRLFSDFSAMSSWFEPCGLVHKEYQACSGAIPVVNKTGGLTEGLKEGINAVFSDFVSKLPKNPTQNAQALAQNSENLGNAFSKALEIFNDKPKFNQMFEASFNADHSWLKPNGSAEEYAKLFVEAGVFKPGIV